MCGSRKSVEGPGNREGAIDGESVVAKKMLSARRPMVTVRAGMLSGTLCWLHRDLVNRSDRFSYSDSV